MIALLSHRLRGARLRINWLGRIALLALWPLVAIASCAAVDQPAPPHPLETLIVIGDDGVAHPLKVEVMRTQKELWTGLRWRKSMPQDQGMLFDLGEVRQAYFTMSDTLIPLDMLFIAADGKIVNIAATTVPGNAGPYMSDGPVRAVLELNAGAALRLHLAPGGVVRNKLFGNLVAVAPNPPAPPVGH
ncbi:MAG: DUF192 domain-containing protein [Alphaproteobacteria bacterium]